MSQKKQYDAIPLIFVGGGGPRQKGGGWDWWNRNGIISTFLFLRFHITLSGKSIYLDPRNTYSQNKISLFYPGSKGDFFLNNQNKIKNQGVDKKCFNHDILQKFEHLFSNWLSKTITVRLSSDFSLEVLDLEHGDAGKYICEVVVWLNF